MNMQKNIDSGQPAQSAQADLGRNFLLPVKFVYFQGIIYVLLVIFS